MEAHRLPNGNLMVPQRVTDAEGTITGDVLVEIGPQHPEYRHWLDWMKRCRYALRRARRQGRIGGRPRVVVERSKGVRLAKAGHTLTEIAAKVGTSKSSAHRILHELAKEKGRAK